MKLAIVTGHSRGLGHALARQLQAQGWEVLGLSRLSAQGLDGVTQWSVDLSDPVPAAERLQAWLAGRTPEQALLINNAALVTEPGPVDTVSLSALSMSMRVGLEAVVLLSAAFLTALRTCPDKRIVNISSGLGRRAMAGAAPYCAVKAGMDHLSRAMAMDEARQPQGARIVSLAPGIIDTDMQVQLRQGDAAKFPDVARFAEFKASGDLETPEAVAAKVLAFAARSDFGVDPIGDVRA
jgi:NAD(P)-dependent dehydrogenase (short-subunit alcohol dehydrogenase family)